MSYHHFNRIFKDEIIFEGTLLQVSDAVACWASGVSTVEEHSPRHPKVQGLSPVAAGGTGKEKTGEGDS